MMVCPACKELIGSAAQARNHALCQDGSRGCTPKLAAGSGLTHEWNVSVGDDPAVVVQIHGGQPDDEGIPEYVISVVLSPGDDHKAAAEQIAAALRGEG